jgi:hypothetical protein
MKNVSDTPSRAHQNTNFTFNTFIFLNRVLYEVTWKNTVEPGRPQMEIWRMRITTNTLSEYVLLIAFPRHQWLYEGALLLRLYVHCLPCYIS